MENIEMDDKKVHARLKSLIAAPLQRRGPGQEVNRPREHCNSRGGGGLNLYAWRRPVPGRSACWAMMAPAQRLIPHGFLAQVHIGRAEDALHQEQGSEGGRSPTRLRIRAS